MGGENGDTNVATRGDGCGHETDSMLDSSSPSVTKQPIGRLSRAADALGLPRRWLLALVAMAVLVLVLLVLVLVLAALWPPAPLVVTRVRCETADCLRAAAQLRSRISGEGGDACDNFWKYTCAAWLHRNPRPASHSQWGVTQQLVYAADLRLQRILSTLPHVQSSHSYKYKLNTFYKGCMDRATKPGVSELTINLNQIIRRLGGFEVLGTFESQAWNPLEAIRVLQAQHNVEVFFRISVMPDLGRRHSSANVIQILPGGVGLPGRDYYFRSHDEQVVTAYQRYIQDVMLRLGATADGARRFAEQMFNYEKRLVESSLDELTLRQRAGSPRRVPVDWLRKESPQVNWLDTLQSTYPKGKINTDTEVVLPDDTYIIELSKIISTTAKSTLNGYLMWRLIAAYHPYLTGSNDRADLDVLRTQLTGVERGPDHWLACTRITREYFPLASGALLAADAGAGGGRQRSGARQVFNSLTQTLGGLLTYSRFISDQNRASLIHQVTSVELMAGYPDLLLEEKLIDSIYKDLNEVMRYDFFKSLEAVRRHQRTLEQMRLMAPGQEWEFEPLLNGVEVAYSRSRNTVVIPDQLLQPPLFDYSYPSAFQYGGIGTRLAEALISSIDPESLVLFLSSDGGDNSTSASHQPSTLAHNQRTFAACVGGVLQARGVPSSVVARVTTSAADQTLAVRLAQEALAHHLDEVGRQELPGLESMSDQQVFFSAYGQSLCEEKTEEKHHWDEFTSCMLDGKTKLELTVEQAASFREAFRCNVTHAHFVQGLCGGLV